MPATFSVLQEGRYSIQEEFSNFDDTLRFRAHDTQLDKEVTIVEVPVRLPEVATASKREEISASFRERAERLVGFRHRSLIAVQSFFVEGAGFYLVTDPVEGTDLATVLNGRSEPFAVAKVTGWADIVMDVLNVMHNSRTALIYGNLRPENIVLRADETVALTGSGMFSMGADDRLASSSATSVSPIAYSPLEQIWGGLDAASQKVIIGKFDESSERILKQDLDARNDLYSLAATLYHLVTGHVPVDALERSIEMIEGKPDPLLSPHTVRPSIPVEVSDVLMKALEIRREYRFDSAAIMRQVLRTALVRVMERKTAESLVDRVEQHALRTSTIDVSKPANATSAADPGVPEDDVIETGQIAPSVLPHSPGIAFNRSTPPDLDDEDVLGLLSPAITPAAIATPRDIPAQTTPPKPQPDRTPIDPFASSTVRGAGGPVDDSSSRERTVFSPPEEQDDPPIDTGVAEREPAFEEPSEHPEVTAHSDTPAPASEAERFPVPARSHSTLSGEIFTEQQPASSVPLTAIAVAAALLIITVVGGWFYFSSAPAPAASAVSSTASEPVQQAGPDTFSTTAAQPAVEPPAGESAVTSEAPATEPSVDGALPQVEPQKVASAVPARQRRPAPASTKAPPQKKVTVDDLINDN